MPVHSLCTPPLPPIGSTHTTHTTLMSSSSKRVNSLISTESDDGAALDAAPPALALTTGIIGVGGGIGDEEAPKKAKKTKKKAAKLKPQNPWGTPLDRAKGSLVTNGNVPVYALHGMDALARSMVGLDEETMLKQHGFPANLTFEVRRQMMKTDMLCEPATV